MTIYIETVLNQIKEVLIVFVITVFQNHYEFILLDVFQ